MCHFPLKLMNPTVNENKWAKRIEREDEKRKKSWKGGGRVNRCIQIKSMECSRFSFSVGKKVLTLLLTCIFN